MTEFKVGDLVQSTKNKGFIGFIENIDMQTDVDPEGDLANAKIKGVDGFQYLSNLKKIYISDTPPPQITQTEVEIKSGHMAGYGVDKPKVVQFLPKTQREVTK